MNAHMKAAIEALTDALAMMNHFTMRTPFHSATMQKCRDALAALQAAPAPKLTYEQCAQIGRDFGLQPETVDMVGRRVLALFPALDTSAPAQGSADLHAAIMNLPCVIPGPHGTKDEHDSYQQGHRDARYAAAELAALYAAHEHAAPAPGSIDTPEFLAMLDAYCTDGTKGYEHHYRKIIAYIDAHIAQRAASDTDLIKTQRAALDSLYATNAELTNQLAQRAASADVGSMAYRGNTVSYIYDRSTAYGNVISECCALIGGKGDLRDRIRTLVASKVSADEVAGRTRFLILQEALAAVMARRDEQSADLREGMNKAVDTISRMMLNCDVKAPAPTASAPDAPAGDLPPLPEPEGTIHSDGYWLAHKQPYAGKFGEVFTADQMHAYVLADRAARAIVTPAGDADPVAQTRFMDEIDAAQVGEKWLDARQTREHTRQYVGDSLSQAPRVKWGALFDSYDKLKFAYLMTRDAMNWTQLTLVDVSAIAAPVAAEPAPRPQYDWCPECHARDSTPQPAPLIICRNPTEPADELAQHCGSAFAAAVHETVYLIRTGKPIVPLAGAADIPVGAVLTKNDATTKGAEP